MLSKFRSAFVHFLLQTSISCNAPSWYFMYHPLVYNVEQRVSYYFCNHETVLTSPFISQLIKNISHSDKRCLRRTIVIYSSWASMKYLDEHHIHTQIETYTNKVTRTGCNHFFALPWHIYNHISLSPDPIASKSQLDWLEIQYEADLHVYCSKEVAAFFCWWTDMILARISTKPWHDKRFITYYLLGLTLRPHDEIISPQSVNHVHHSWLWLWESLPLREG